MDASDQIFISSGAGGNEREQDILQAALGLFLRYGYRRVTMDDIASDAGMSRPALYQFHANKKALYRAIVTQLVAQSLDRMRLIAAGEGSGEDRVFSVIREGVLAMMEWLEKTSHGAELLDLSGELCQDIISSFAEEKTAVLSGIYAEYLQGTGISPQDVAWQLTDWLEGMKARIRVREEREAALRLFLSTQFAGLRANQAQARAN